MQVLDLPLPAFECVIEHLVVTVGLYRAVRLRLVCKAFDAEIRRAIFARNLVDFNKDSHLRVMTPEILQIWFMAKIARPTSKDQDAVSSAIIGVTKLLLAGTPTPDYDERRLAYVKSLCHAIAHNFVHHIHSLFDTMSQTDNGFSITADDLLSAAAVVADLHTVRRLLLERSELYSQSRIFGHISANAARNGDKDMLILIIETSRKPKSALGLKNSTCMTLLAACRAGQQDIVNYLLSLPSSQTYFLDHNFDHGFEAAAANGHTHILRLLLPHLSTTSRDDVLSRSLRQASAWGHSIAVQYLLKSGSDPDSWAPPGGALHLAARSGFSQVVRVLLNHGADPNLRAMRNGQPLFFAVKNGHTEVVQILLDHGADVNARGNIHSGLARAARNGELTMVKYLLDKGVDLVANGNGDRALQQAAGQGHEDIVRLLVELGVNVNGHGDSQDPPILQAMLRGQQHVIKVLLELGAKEQHLSDTRYASRLINGSLPRPRK
ncbi:MAG: hypothetical protein Q9178_006208 [Gyalolechia marmorata]